MTAGRADSSGREPGAARSGDATVLDATVLQSLVSRMGDRGPAMLARLLETWETETDKRLAELDGAVAADDPEALARAAHAIRGGSASIGALQLAEACGQVETSVHAGEQVDLRAGRDGIRVAVEQARIALRQLRVGSGG